MTGDAGKLWADLSQNLQSFSAYSGARVDRPVIFPPGLREARDDPGCNRVAFICAITMGIVAVASLAARVGPYQPYTDDSYLEPH